MSTGKKIRAMLATLIGTGMIAFSAHAKNSLFIVINDHLGTPQMLIDEHKNIVWHAEYDEFGKADILVEKTEFNLRFPGQYYDKETGLHYNYYRDYDPSTGRYVQSDPIGLSGGINTYAYALGNPISFSDRLGLEVTMVCRPIMDTIPNKLGMKHCSVFVWKWVADGDCNKKKEIIAQYSVAGGTGVLPPDGCKGPTCTFPADTDAFNNPGGSNEHYDIPVPSGMTQDQFDEAVQQSGNNYNSGEPYSAIGGPNSNTASDNIIETAKGVAPNVPGAFMQNYGEPGKWGDPMRTPGGP